MAPTIAAMLLTLHSAGAGFEAACPTRALPEGHRSRRLHGHSYFAQARCALPSGWAPFASAEVSNLKADGRRRVGGAVGVVLPMLLQRFSLDVIVRLAACLPGDPDGADGTTGTGSGSGTSTTEVGGTTEAMPSLPPPVEAELAPGTGPEGPVAMDRSADAAALDAVPPIGHRVARRTTLVFAEPRWGAELRGRVDMDNPFAIYELVEGKGCTVEGWARVDAMGYACLKGASVSKRRGRAQPPVPAGRVVPYAYAKARADRAGELLAPVPRWASVPAMLRGDAPRDWLAASH